MNKIKEKIKCENSIALNATGERRKKIRNKYTLSVNEMQENLKSLRDPEYHDFTTKRHKDHSVFKL